MARRSETPIEDRDYSRIYFLCSALLALVTFWAVIDMIWVRSPWQRVQREFNRLERRQLLNQREARLAALDQKRYQALEQALAEARAELNSAAYRQALQDSAGAARAIARAVQAYRFTKSEADAEYYLYKEAQYHDDAGAAARHGSKYEALSARAAELKVEWDQTEARKAEVLEQLARHRRKIHDLQSQMAAMTHEIGELDFRLSRLDERRLKIEQVVMPEFVKGNFGAYLNNVDRCHTCHVSVARAGFENFPAPYQTHPAMDELLRVHPLEKFGCTPCHDGQGPALENVRTAHGEVKHWEHPLLRDDFVYAGCNKCHANELRTDHAPSLNRAKRMLVDLGCYGCHEIRGFENAERIGPNLGRITSKLTPAWLYGWLRDNRAFRPHSRMPNPGFTPEEARAATAFLFASARAEPWTPARPPLNGNAANGEKLVATVGCKGCHVVTPADRELRQDGLPYDMAPDLSTVAAKVSSEWLFDWIKNPKRFAPDTRMPDLRLTDQEAADAVAYLVELGRSTELPPEYREAPTGLDDPKLLEEGRAVMRNFGCHGCHLIPGMENESRVSVSLNEFGAKTPEELFYGDALANGTVPARTWEAWTIGKLQHARVYATEAVIQRMPDYEMSVKDATTMAVLLRSWDGRVVGERYTKPWHGRDEDLQAGRLLVRQLNCTGCHAIEGEGGDLRPTLAAALMREGMDEIVAGTYAPPDLAGEGRKVQAEWLFHFLKYPQTSEIRPWLRTRMPTFGLTDAQANTLINYFKSLEGEPSGFTYLPDFHLTAGQRNAALRLVSRDYFDCFSCHQQGSRKPPGPPEGWAPDLAMARARLDPHWIAEWIRDPQALQPGTRMPSFYPESYPPDILNGEPEAQITALRNYLISLGR